MRIVICIKPVKTEYVFANNHQDEAFSLNPYDVSPLIDIMTLKKNYPCEVISLSMGAPNSKQILVKLKAVGVDRVILLSDSKFAGADTIATSQVLYHAIKKIGDVDIVVFGHHAVDGETGHVGIGVSEFLKRECILGIKSIQSLDKAWVVAQRDAEGMRQKIAVDNPFVAIYSDFTVQPLEYSLMALKRAKKIGIEVWNFEYVGVAETHCGLRGSKTKVHHVERELPSKENQIIDGSVEEQTDKLFQIIGYR